MIGEWSTNQLAPALDALCEGPDVQFSSVSNDTRTLQPGALYVALKGERFDGHEFVAQAVEKGAVAVLVSQGVRTTVTQLKVADTRWALGQLAAVNRDRFNGQVVAVTGSSGKTTVKEMVAAILRQAGEVLATRGNLNNDIGAPLTLLQLSETQRFAVIELGASAVGEIAYSVSLTRPHVSIITNAAGAHLEGFGGIEQIRRAKGEILGGLKEGGVAVLNADDPAFAQWQNSCVGRQVLTFGAGQADFTAQHIHEAEGVTEFTLLTPQGSQQVRMGFAGRHNVANALAAAAAASALGLSLAQIAAGLAAAQAVKGRLNRLRTRAGGLLLDDTYNANPASVKAALDVLAAQTGTRVAVLGNMAELGAAAASLHGEVGSYARQIGIDQLLACGENAAAMAEGFGSGAQAFAKQEDLIQHLQAGVRSDMTFLVKGSRSARMERVVEALTATRDTAAC